MKNTYAWLTLILTATFVVSPAFTNPFMGFTADQLPYPQIDPPVQPAGYAFAIWGLIYSWLVVSAVFGVWKRRSDAAWDHVRAPLMISLAVGTPWLAIANASAVWATITIFIMSAAAIVALIRAPKVDGWWLQAPVGIYAGWLTAASFVSLGSTAAGYGIALGSLGWAYLAIILALGVTLAVIARKPTAPEYGITVIWALIGIIVANLSGAVGVMILAAAGIIVVAGATWKARSPA
ncbi:MAG: hypothetical protein MUR46_09290 [Loktanella sp.]|nr:hypothetical protein [Loktanella sp.]MDO7623818.1 hypothetical protein [Loktanella sp.]MDO7625554.1 hypothetical protein [Loktanella sp.]MDO7629318.1 hypothetical protein [Loktanella sp.]MDO7666702.1 hypothetical protein [Loktanella sp.]